MILDGFINSSSIDPIHLIITLNSWGDEISKF